MEKIFLKGPLSVYECREREERIHRKEGKGEVNYIQKLFSFTNMMMMNVAVTKAEKLREEGKRKKKDKKGRNNEEMDKMCIKFQFCSRMSSLSDSSYPSLVKSCDPKSEARHLAGVESYQMCSCGKRARDKVCKNEPHIHHTFI